jgi:hypothetical protein
MPLLRRPALSCALLLAIVGEGCSSQPRDGLAGEIERVLAPGGDPTSLALTVECRREQTLRSLRAYGHGVAICDERRELPVTRGEVDELLRVLVRDGLDRLAPTYGHPEQDHAVTQMTCRVDITLPPRHKEVVQLAEGEQSAELSRLAGDLLELCAHRPGGTTAADLEDGLQKVARGELSAESWSVAVQRRKPASPGEVPSEGYVLQLGGRRARVRLLTRNGVGEASERLLDEAGVRDLARALRELGVARWPANLFDPGYVELSMRVLDHERTIQARPFAGITPGAHREAQEALGAALARVDELARSVVAGGPAPL